MTTAFICHCNCYNFPFTLRLTRKAPIKCNAFSQDEATGENLALNTTQATYQV